MSTKKHVKALWDYLCAEFEADEITAAFEATVEGFEYDVADINAAMIDALSEDEAGSLLFDMSYMAVNEFYGGDLRTWYEFLIEGLGFDEETIEDLEY